MGWQATCRAWFGQAVLTLAAAVLPAAGVLLPAGESAAQDVDSGSADGVEEAMQQGNPSAGEAKKAFEAAFEAYRQELAAIEAMQSDFHSAKESDRARINTALQERYPKSAAIFEGMIDAAVAAYRAAPEADPQITELMLTVAAHRIGGNGKSRQGGDDYEAALEVINALIDGGNKNPQLPLWGLIAAYTTNDLDLAEKYDGMARASGAFADPPSDKNEVAQEVFSMAVGMSESLARHRPLWEAEEKTRNAEAKADDLPRVQLQTTEGTMVIELFENEAPQAVANFITLVKQGYYDGIVFHRVLPGFMAQGGDPRGDGTGGPGHNIPCECYQENARMHFRGSLSMAHAGRNTGGSQFFLTFIPTSHLNGKHTVFGRVSEGLDVLAKLVRVDPKERAKTVSKIVKAEVLRDRGHDYSTRFDKLPER